MRAVKCQVARYCCICALSADARCARYRADKHTLADAAVLLLIHTRGSRNLCSRFGCTFFGRVCVSRPHFIVAGRVCASRPHFIVAISEFRCGCHTAFAVPSQFKFATSRSDRAKKNLSSLSILTSIDTTDLNHKYVKWEHTQLTS